MARVKAFTEGCKEPGAHEVPEKSKLLTEVHKGVSTPTPMHPLIAAGFHNRTKSPLCRLPQAVLTRLLQLSDNVTVECLRRCSRLFLRLAPAARPAGDFSRKHGDRHPWPTSEQQWLPGESETFLDLMTRDEYCAGCLAARRSPDWQSRVEALTKTYLHCSGCDADHPACLFSARQRVKERSKRVCIGHEGHVPLCKHVKVSWSMILKAAERRLPIRTQGGKWKDPVETRCWSMGHSWTCRYRWLPRLGFEVVPQRCPKLYLAACCPSKPTLSVAYMIYVPSEEELLPRYGEVMLQVTLAWSGHLSLTTRPDGRYEAEDMGRGIRDLYRQEGHIICPPLAPGPAIGSRLGDPCRCDCLEYSGKMTSGWEQPPVTWRLEETCRTSQTLGISCHNPKRMDHDSVRREHGSSKRRCYNHWTKFSGLEEYYAQSADIIRCNRGNGCMTVTYKTRFGLPLDGGRIRRMDRTWYQTLDPDSYKLTEDSDGFGVYWCKAQGCRGYYRFNRSRLKGLLEPSDYVHPCR